MISRLRVSIALPLLLHIGRIYSCEASGSAQDKAVMFDCDNVISVTYYSQLQVTLQEARDRLLNQENKHKVRATLSPLNMVFDKHVQSLLNLEMMRDDATVAIVYLVTPIIESIRKLRSQGYTVIAATNQRWDYYSRVYEAAIYKQHNIQLSSLFDAVLTTTEDEKKIGNNSYYRLDEQRNLYVVNDNTIAKPKKAYFEIARELIQNINPKVTTVIHVDDLEVNVTGAIAAGLCGIHFDAIQGSAAKADLDQAMVAYWNALKGHHVSCD